MTFLDLLYSRSFGLNSFSQDIEQTEKLENILAEYGMFESKEDIEHR